MESIKLNFINRSDDTSDVNVVIFQQNIAKDRRELVFAWKVIQNCKPLEIHPIIYPLNFVITVGDAYGNYTSPVSACEGQTLKMTSNLSGHTLQLTSIPAANSNQIEVSNDLPQGAINTNCFKDGKLLASKTGTSTGQKAVFEFQSKIFIGVESKVEEGDVLKSSLISRINNEINLVGISNADIVMTGGGSGKGAEPFKFSLENINQVSIQ
jgi:hypothetical protein